MQKEMRYFAVGMVVIAVVILGGRAYGCTSGPEAVLTLNSDWVLPGDKVILYGHESYDSDGEITEYRFDFDGDDDDDYTETSSSHTDGKFDGMTTHTYSTKGIYEVKLTVVDDETPTGNETSTTCTLRVGRVIRFNSSEQAQDAYDTISSAFGDQDLSEGDVIEVFEGIYGENITFPSEDCTLTSRDPDDWQVVANTIINGGGSDSVVKINNSQSNDTVLKGFTITNGSANYGGGIYCEGSLPTIANCIIEKNHSNNGGGGIECYNSASPKIRNCVFIGNVAGGCGGGIDIISNSDPTIENCTFFMNNGNSGGGVYIRNAGMSTPELTNCTFSKNDASASGGGIYFWDSATTIVTNSIFYDNSAGNPGDEIYNYENGGETLVSYDN